MVEEGVATAETSIGRSRRLGFRFAVLGMLEFIDWGGGDIFYYASRYLTEALGTSATRPRSSSATWKAASGCGAGRADYAKLDIDAYRRDRLVAPRHAQATDLSPARAGGVLRVP
jgi:3-hydroxybutyryl-CoA dehydrogenase